MFGNHGYDYTRVFFRKPIWTPANIRYWKFLGTTAAVVLFFFYAMTTYFSNYSAERIKEAVKRNYIAQLVEYYEARPVMVPEEEVSYAYFNPGEILADIRDEVETVGEREVREMVADPQLQRRRAKTVRNANTEITDKATEYDHSLVSFLKSPDKTSQTVRNAIDGIATRVNPTTSQRYAPMEPYLTRKKAYASTVREFNDNTDEENVGIADGTFTDFDILSGVRDYEETMGVANDNKRTVQRCVDKYYRNNPTFRGTVEVKFDIHPEGYVIERSIHIVESDIKDVRVLNCIKKTIRRWRNFPPVAYENGEYGMTQKFIF